jgi:hypothetical protein
MKKNQQLQKKRNTLKTSQQGFQKKSSNVVLVGSEWQKLFFVLVLLLKPRTWQILFNKLMDKIDIQRVQDSFTKKMIQFFS